MTIAGSLPGHGSTRQRALQDGAAVAALIAVWLAALAWARPLMLPDEGRYVGVAWEMLRSGDWLTPTLDGMPYFHKPPLFYWITAASMSLFGAHARAARAAPLLGAGLGAFALHAFVRRWLSEEIAHRSVGVPLVLPMFYLGGQFANLDMLVAGFIVATVLLLAHAALCAERGLPHRGARESAYAMAAPAAGRRVDRPAVLLLRRAAGRGDPGRHPPLSSPPGRACCGDGRPVTRPPAH